MGLDSFRNALHGVIIRIAVSMALLFIITSIAVSIIYIISTVLLIIGIFCIIVMLNIFVARSIRLPENTSTAASTRTSTSADSTRASATASATRIYYVLPPITATQHASLSSSSSSSSLWISPTSSFTSSQMPRHQQQRVYSQGLLAAQDFNFMMQLQIRRGLCLIAETYASRQPLNFASVAFSTGSARKTYRH